MELSTLLIGLVYMFLSPVLRYVSSGEDFFGGGGVGSLAAFCVYFPTFFHFWVSSLFMNAATLDMQRRYRVQQLLERMVSEGGCTAMGFKIELKEPMDVINW